MRILDSLNMTAAISARVQFIVNPPTIADLNKQIAEKTAAMTNLVVNNPLILSDKPKEESPTGDNGLLEGYLLFKKEITALKNNLGDKTIGLPDFKTALGNVCDNFITVIGGKSNDGVTQS